MNRAVILLLAMACTYQPSRLEVSPCDPDCRGECIDGECVVATGGACSDDVVCRDECVCSDPDCSQRVCAEADCGPCGFSPDGLSCAGNVEDGVPCEPGACALEAACTRGACATTRPRSCNDDDPCTDDTCDPTPADGRCLNPRRTSCGPSYFSYHREWAVLAVGLPIPPIVPVLQSDGMVTVSVSPPLPSGLLLEPTTGAISGTPNTYDGGATLDYTFTASTGNGVDLTDDLAIRIVYGLEVDTGSDFHDSVLDGTCYSVDNPGSCSLRAAVEEALNATQPHAVHISPAAGLVELTLGPIPITGAVYIYGDGWDTSRLSGTSSPGRFFNVDGGELWLSDVRLKHGRAQGAGAIRIDGGALLRLQRTELLDNRNEAGAPTASDEGGAIHVEDGSAIVEFCSGVENRKMTSGNGPGFLSVAPAGSATVTFSTFTGNRGQHGGVFRALNGGSIYVHSSFMSDNHAELAPNGDGGVVDAGDGPCQVTLVNNTMVGNTARSDGAVLFSTCTNQAQLHHNTMVDNDAENVVFATSAVLTNNIFANPVRECLVTAVTPFGNLGHDDTCWATAATNNRVLRREDLALEPPGENGGPTPSIRPRPDSPAVDGGSYDHCNYPTDQRGLPRTDGACDAGAVELQ